MHKTNGMKEKLLLLVLSPLCISCVKAYGADISAGPLYEEFRLTLGLGERKEVIAPLFSVETQEGRREWTAPPLFFYATEANNERSEFDFLYAFFTYDRNGSEYRVQLLQLLSFAGGQNQAATQTRRTTLFPIYFQQRSDDPAKNYTAVFPLYG